MAYKDPEYGKARRKELRLAKVEYWREYHREYAKTYDYRDRQRVLHVKRTYGLNPDEYLQMILDQNNCCAICHKPEMKKTKQGDACPLCVDHCHKTGKVRALLCAKCNGMLGMVDDNEDHLSAAINYLRQHKGE